MQKVRSYYIKIFARAAYKTTISDLSLTQLYAVAHISYLALEEGSPYIQTDFPFYFFNISVDRSYQKIRYILSIQIITYHNFLDFFR